MGSLTTTFIYNSLVMSVLTSILLLVLPYLRKRYSAKWLSRILLLITACWDLPFRPPIEYPTMLMPEAVLPAEWVVGTIESASMTDSFSGMMARSTDGFSLQLLLVIAWALGILIIGTNFLLRQLRFQRFVSRWSRTISDNKALELLSSIRGELGIKRPIQLKSCGGIPSPMLTGYITPTILLPEQSYTDQELTYILKHECIHYRRKDLYGKLLMLIAVVLNWFNPIVWWLNRSYALQSELACDEQVLHQLSNQQRKEYGSTILYVVKNQWHARPFLSTNFHGRKHDLSIRIYSMMEHKGKRSGLLVLVVLVAAIVMAACKPASEPDLVTGYIVLDHNTLWLDEVEIITLDDQERMEQLGLSQGNMPNGYYILDVDSERIPFEITNKTKFTFTDYHLLFIDDADGNRLYTTSEIDQFKQHLRTSYSDDPPAGSVPFFVEVHNGKVIHITERLIFTQ